VEESERNIEKERALVKKTYTKEERKRL